MPANSSRAITQRVKRGPKAGIGGKKGGILRRQQWHQGQTENKQVFNGAEEKERLELQRSQRSMQRIKARIL